MIYPEINVPNKMHYFKMKLARILITLCMLCICGQCLRAESRIYSINADDWARPRSGANLLQYDALRQLMQDWSKLNEGMIEIRFPGGEMGSLWASELQDWLVALGIASDNIRLLPGRAGIDSIDLVIIAEK